MAETWAVIGILAAGQLGIFFYLGARIDALGIGLGNRIDALASRMDTRFNAVDTRFNAVDTRFNAVDARLDALTARIDAHLVEHARRRAR
jgi:hypothetical protein